MCPLHDCASTFFAPAGRDTEPELQRKQILVRSAPLLQETIDAMGDAVVILNGNRQIVGINRPLLEMLACQPDHVLGRRLGEIIGCHNTPEGPDGCGTAPDCVTCGAIEAILASQKCEHKVTRECRVSLQEPIAGALDLSVSATAVRVGDERFSICVVRDISDQKRLSVLARLFFHDVINTAGGIQGYVELLRDRRPEDSPDDQELADMAELADQLLEEIRSQRDLIYAESDDLEPESELVCCRALLERLQKLYAKHPVAKGRFVVLGDAWEGSVTTDPRLLSRILGNMFKNALEAITAGETVTISCTTTGDSVVFSVHNPGMMPQQVQRQVFQRSFSTKATSGRGIGTHSMKLFGERYLGGQVGFSSTESDGTHFHIAIPKV